jgi:hypothetical protein
VALRQEVAAKAVGDLGRIDAVVLLFGRSDGPQQKQKQKQEQKQVLRCAQNDKVVG